MAVEVQKLIAVSLGKIAASRSQRGGPSLHKSLLVSSVLYKARTTYNFHAFMAKRAQQVEISTANSENGETAGQCEEVVVRVGHPKPGHEGVSPAESPNKQPLNGSTCLPEDNKRPRGANTCFAEDKENSPPNVKPCNPADENVTLLTKDCAKCVKRRMSDVRDSADSCTVAKRAKCDSENCDSATDKSEAMQTDSQISSLVQRFNTGLSNFLGSNSGHLTSKNGNSDCLNSQIAGHAESIVSLTTCSTQMKKDNVMFTDNLGSRPVIALSV